MRVNEQWLETLRKAKAFIVFKLEALEGAIGALRKEDEEIIRGIYIDNKSRREICNRLFISENTLHRRRRRALAAMEENLSMIFLFKET